MSELKTAEQWMEAAKLFQPEIAKSLPKGVGIISTEAIRVIQANALRWAEEKIKSNALLLQYGVSVPGVIAAELSLRADLLEQGEG